MNILHTLNEKLLKQSFNKESSEPTLLSNYKQIAYVYSKIENSIAVLSDLRTNKSYIYNGGVAAELGIFERDDIKEINSIWEEEIFNKIHPDDLLNKHLLELRYFHLLKNLPISERADYHVTSTMRMRDKSDKYIMIKHRMFYISSSPQGSLWIALCLYNHCFVNTKLETSNGIIVNSATGNIIKPESEECNNILSEREKEILSLIEKGNMSKDIADLLSISINTVNRHRQNILEKLRVKNSIEACRVAKLMELL